MVQSIDKNYNKYIYSQMSNQNPTVASPTKETVQNSGSCTIQNKQQLFPSTQSQSVGTMYKQNPSKWYPQQLDSRQPNNPKQGVSSIKNQKQTGNCDKQQLPQLYRQQQQFQHIQKSLRQQLSSYQQNNSILTKKVEQLEYELQVYKEKEGSEARYRMVDQQAKAHQQIQLLQTSLHHEKNKSKSLEEQISHMQKQCATLKNENTGLQQHIQTLVEQMQNVRSLMSEQEQASQHELHMLHESSTHQIHAISHQLEKSRQCQMELRPLQTLIQARQKDIQRLEIELNKIIQENQSLRKLRTINVLLSQGLMESQSRFQALRKDNQELKAQINKLNDKLQQLNRQNQQLQFVMQNQITKIGNIEQPQNENELKPNQEHKERSKPRQLQRSKQLQQNISYLKEVQNNFKPEFLNEQNVGGETKTITVSNQGEANNNYNSVTSNNNYNISEIQPNKFQTHSSHNGEDPNANAQFSTHNNDNDFQFSLDNASEHIKNMRNIQNLNSKDNPQGTSADPSAFTNKKNNPVEYFNQEIQASSKSKHFNDSIFNLQLESQAYYKNLDDSKQRSNKQTASEKARKFMEQKKNKIKQLVSESKIKMFKALQKQPIQNESQHSKQLNFPLSIRQKKLKTEHDQKKRQLTAKKSQRKGKISSTSDIKKNIKNRDDLEIYIPGVPESSESPLTSKSHEIGSKIQRLNSRSKNSNNSHDHIKEKKQQKQLSPITPYPQTSQGYHNIAGAKQNKLEHNYFSSIPSSPSVGLSPSVNFTNYKQFSGMNLSQLHHKMRMQEFSLTNVNHKLHSLQFAYKQLQCQYSQLEQSKKEQVAQFQLETSSNIDIIQQLSKQLKEHQIANIYLSQQKLEESNKYIQQLAKKDDIIKNLEQENQALDAEAKRQYDWRVQIGKRLVEMEEERWNMRQTLNEIQKQIQQELNNIKFIQGSIEQEKIKKLKLFTQTEMQCQKLEIVQSQSQTINPQSCQNESQTLVFKYAQSQMQTQKQIKPILKQASTQTKTKINAKTKQRQYSIMIEPEIKQCEQVQIQTNLEQKAYIQLRQQEMQTDYLVKQKSVLIQKSMQTQKFSQKLNSSPTRDRKRQLRIQQQNLCNYLISGFKKMLKSVPTMTDQHRRRDQMIQTIIQQQISHPHTQKSNQRPVMRITPMQTIHIASPVRPITISTEMNTMVMIDPKQENYRATVDIASLTDSNLILTVDKQSQCGIPQLSNPSHSQSIAIQADYEFIQRQMERERYKSWPLKRFTTNMEQQLKQQIISSQNQERIINKFPQSEVDTEEKTIYYSFTEQEQFSQKSDSIHKTRKKLSNIKNNGSTYKSMVNKVENNLKNDVKEEQKYTQQIKQLTQLQQIVIKQVSKLGRASSKIPIPQISTVRAPNINSKTSGSSSFSHPIKPLYDLVAQLRDNTNMVKTFYVINCLLSYNENIVPDKLLIWKQGLVSLTLGGCLIMNHSITGTKFVYDPVNAVLGNCQIIINPINQEVEVLRAGAKAEGRPFPNHASKRGKNLYFIGSIVGNWKWKIINVEGIGKF